MTAPAPALPTVSLIVATYNRARLVNGLIAAVASQTYPRERFELILVDDGSADDTSERARRSAPADLDVTILRQANSGPAAARNAGAETAKGELLYFFDDDQRPDPGWLVRAVEAFLARPGRVLTGPVMIDGTDPISWYNLQQSHIFQAAAEQRQAEAVESLLPGNCLMTRSDFWAAGGYDAEQRVAEADRLARNLIALGRQLWFDPALAMPHIVDHRQRAGDFWHYYATVAAGDCIRDLAAGGRRRAVARALRITATLPLVVVKLAGNYRRYRRTPFSLAWRLRFLGFDLGGACGYRIGYWWRFLQGPAARP